MVTSGNYATPANNGWSLFTFTQATDNQCIRILIDPVTGDYDADIKIGCILIGKYIDMPYSPDLNIKRNWNEGEGAVLSESSGGMRYSNLNYRKAPDWYLAPYQVSTNSTPEVTSRSGRLVYDLSFSYISDDKFIPTDLGLTDSGHVLYTGDTVLNILQYTIGSHLPFLYQWDNTVSGNYDFILARAFREAETQQANNVWKIAMRIEEEF